MLRLTFRFKPMHQNIKIHHLQCHQCIQMMLSFHFSTAASEFIFWNNHRSGLPHYAWKGNERSGSGEKGEVVQQSSSWLLHRSWQMKSSLIFQLGALPPNRCSICNRMRVRGAKIINITRSTAVILLGAATITCVSRHVETWRNFERASLATVMRANFL